MILLDTNVISETMRPDPNTRVAAWMMAQSVSDLATTAITQAEILKGIEMMPLGKKRGQLLEVAQAYFHVDMASRILSFNSAAAHRFAEIFAHRRKIGRQIQPLDAQIAAIAREHHAALATRNIDDFTDCGIELINPWHVR